MYYWRVVKGSICTNDLAGIEGKNLIDESQAGTCNGHPKFMITYKG
jgi:hypothetical protein